MNIYSIDQILRETSLEFRVDKNVHNDGDHIVWVYIPEYTDLTKLDFIREEFDAEYAEVSYSEDKEKVFVKYRLKSGDNIDKSDEI